MMLWFAIALGGALGAMTRHGVNIATARLIGTGFPWGTLVANLLGSALMGVLIVLLGLRLNLSQELRALITVGFLGAFTTFSAFSLDAVVLWERGSTAAALLYVLGSVCLSILALYVSMRVTRGLLA